MHRFKHKLFIAAALFACLLVGVAESIGHDLHTPLGILADAIASRFTLAPSLLRAGSDRAELVAVLYARTRLVLAILFAGCLYLQFRRRAVRPRATATLLIGVQMIAAAATMSSLAILAAAQMPAALPLRRALFCLAAQCVLRVAIALWMMLGTGLALKDSTVVNMLLLLGVDLAIDALAFGISYLVVREQRARSLLAASHAELLATQALLDGTVRASERLRIARDLHDIVGHHLTALILHLDLAVRQSAAPSEALRTSRELARTLLAEVRVVVAQEREGEPIDLRAVLTTLCDGIPHPAVTLQFEEQLEIVSPALAHAVFCCVQESLSNALRHADASAITVSVGQRDGQLQVRIADDGHGGWGAVAGNGLAGMRERAAALGGVMAAASLAGRGYAVSIALPFAGVAP